MDTNTARVIAHIYLAAERVGIVHHVADQLWAVRSLTPAGQREAIARWEQCMETWPAA